MKNLGVYSFDELSLGYNLAIRFKKYTHWAAFTNTLFLCLCELSSMTYHIRVYLFLINSKVKIKGGGQFSAVTLDCGIDIT